MSKWSVMLLVAVMAIGFQSQAEAVTLFRANLTPEQVVPGDADPANDPDGEPAYGIATLRLNAAMTELSYRVQLFNVDAVGLGLTPDTADDINAIHIHTAPIGSNGPHVLNIFGQPGINLGDNDGDASIIAEGNTVIVSGLWTDADATADQNIGGSTKLLSASLDDLFAGNLYFQLHSNTYTSANNTGILRGQVHEVPEPVTVALSMLSLGALGMATRRRMA